MIEEQKYFLCILRDYLNEEKTVISEPIDWMAVFNYAQTHQLTAIAYHQCKAFLPLEVTELFKSKYLSTVSLYIQRKKVSDTILASFREHDIDCFMVKGFDIAEYYPHPQFRTMGDTDIVVSDKEKAHCLLINDGFVSLTKNRNKEYTYLYNNMEFELHDRLVYEEAINLDSMTRFLNDYKEYVVEGKIDGSFHLIFVLNHLRKHFMNSGVGFRQFVDVAVLIKNDKRINWCWTEKKLGEIGLLPFAKKVFYFIERWFNVVAPISAENVTEVVYESSTDYVFNNGVFGFNNKENKLFLAANTVRKSKYPQIAMMKSAIDKVFPSYKMMTSSEYYTFLRGKPYLLPIAWIYRLFSGSKRKGLKTGAKQIAGSFVSNEYILQREEMFQNWNLE